jgi:quercetin dioxygenase-like cupin family protein
MKCGGWRLFYYKSKEGELPKMEGKEPHAPQEEYSKYVIRYTDVPTVGLAPGIKAHIISADRITLSFSSCEPNAEIPFFRHENEQIIIVTDGAIDFVVDGKQYHLEKGDVVIIPSNIEHGGTVSDKGCRVIDVFSPSRKDLVAKLEEVKKSQTS